MLIDGQPVVEIDVTASFLTILHAKCGRPLDLTRDPYAIEALPRSVVKAWVTMTLGHDKFHTRWPRAISQDYLEEHGKKIGAVHPLRGVHQAVTRALPLLAEWPDLPLSCFDLMYIESEAVVGTMLRLMRERGVVCLSVHDSIIVPLPERDAAVQVLREEYRRTAGVKPKLTIHVPSEEVQQVMPAA